MRVCVGARGTVRCKGEEQGGRCGAVQGCCWSVRRDDYDGGEAQVGLGLHPAPLLALPLCLSYSTPLKACTVYAQPSAQGSCQYSPR